MPNLMIIPIEEFQRVQAAKINKYDRLSLISDMCRANTLTAVKKAGSGHLGSSLSAMDIITWLYYQEMNTLREGFGSNDRDIYFSSKGHDVPGLYALLFSLGVLPEEMLLKLRRLGGLDGHPHVSIPGIEANSGSLGMGISKGKGMAFAKQLKGYKGRVFVLTGDGELQEGQIYEALQTAVNQGLNNLNVIVDHNKVQSDKPVKEISDLGDLAAKFKAFGWHVARCDGHDFQQLENILNEFKTIAGQPKILIADTIKGRGVSFMEHPAALLDGNGLYRWHSGAPDDHAFAKAFEEVANRINDRMNFLELNPLALKEVKTGEKAPSGVSKEYVADAFGKELVGIAAERKDVIVLDADLASDCRLRDFEAAFPDRFIENGIAEQDMVSMAGGLALQGLLPVVNTFAAFLSSRANEQIYTNACEGTKIIYVCHYSGVIPAGPGQSHQSIRDISLFGALPNFEIIQPCNAVETRMALNYCVKKATNNCVIRLIIGPSPRIVNLPENYQLQPGVGAVLHGGEDAVLFAYGPVMLNEALIAADMLKKLNFNLKVINMPWLNQVDVAWLESTVGDCPYVYVLEDHAPVGGLGDYMLNELVKSKMIQKIGFKKIAIEGYPVWGTPAEVLKHHKLDGASLSDTILMTA
jgi:transketolase